MPCLDATVLLDLMGRGGRDLRDRAQKRIVEIASSGEALLTTRFTVAELYTGVCRARNRQDEEHRVGLVLGGLGILDFDDAAAWQFGSITAALQRVGRPVGIMDALIAATAMAAGEAVLTRNSAHFRDIPGLVVEEY